MNLLLHSGSGQTQSPFSVVLHKPLGATWVRQGALGAAVLRVVTTAFSKEHFPRGVKVSGRTQEKDSPPAERLHVVYWGCSSSSTAHKSVLFLRESFLILDRCLLVLLILCFLSFININVYCLLKFLFATNKSSFVYLAPATNLL